jgi:phage terminase large subunit-like protein
MECSEWDKLKALPKAVQCSFLDELTDAEVLALATDWAFFSRPSQQTPPEPWTTWVAMAGRGWGKTRVGAEWVREQVKNYAFVNLIGATSDDARDIMVEGESGILSICASKERPVYLKNSSKLKWPNGATSLIFTADKPERLRGKQHMKIWADEVASWRYKDAWDQAQFGLRLGNNPQSLVTTTPKPTKLIKEILKLPNLVVTNGSTDDNKQNLAKAFFDTVIAVYEGTRLEKQERYGKLLEDIEGSLWSHATINLHRVKKAPELVRIIIAVDPAVTSNADSDETGIIAAGLGYDDHVYILKDSSLRDTPYAWASLAVKEYHSFAADKVVGEANNGGDLVEINLRIVDENINYAKVHASRGKIARAEPVAALYEQGKVHHVGDDFEKLETEMVELSIPDPKVSPNRMDALVWAVYELKLKNDTLRIF